MASINQASRSTAARTTETTHEGAPVRRITPLQQLKRTVMTCLLWEDNFYEDGQSVGQRICELCYQVDKADIAQLAIEARQKMQLRHVPLLLCREMARKGGGVPYLADTLEAIIQRADELTEFLALYWSTNLKHAHAGGGVKKSIPAQVKRGLARAFTKFDAYQLAKYDRAGAVRLRDVMFMCHPKPKDMQQAETWKALVDGTLPAPDTWEVALSAGKETKEKNWERLLSERKLGGLALLRNLRNIQEAKVPEAVIAGAIADNPFKRVLPYRFVAAAQYAPLFEAALEQGMYRALADTEPLEGKTAFLVDVSASMTAPISAKSQMTRADVACSLAILLREICHQGVFVAFATDVAAVPARRGFALRDAFAALSGRIGYGTNMEDAKRLADKHGYDRVVIISDMQSHQPLSNPKGRGYCVNVAPYQNGVGYGPWTQIDGWSEAIVSYIRAYEEQEGTE